MEYVKLQDVCEFINGDRGKNYPKSSEYVEKGIPFVNAGHIEESKIAFSKMNYISEEVYGKLGSGKVKKQDILFCLRGSLGKSALVDFEKGAIASSLVILRNKNETRLNTSYLMYVLNSHQITKQINKTNTGSSQPNLSANNVKNYIIPLPSLMEQNHIVGVLESAQSLIDKRKKQITALSELMQSVYLEMFGDPYRNDKGWEIEHLKDIATIIMGQSPPGESYNEVGNGLPLLNGPAEFTDKYPQEKQWTTSPKKLTEKGDILFCVRGATAGRMNLSDKTYAIGRGLAAIRVSRNTDLHFVFLTLKYMYSHFQNTSNGSTFINIDKKTLEYVPIFKVKDCMKEKYFQISEQVQRQQFILEQSLRDLENNYYSLMQRAFKGELFNN